MEFSDLEYIDFIASWISHLSSPNLDGEAFVGFDKFVDNQLENGGIVKHSTYKFSGVVLAKKISERCVGDGIKLIPEEESDFRCVDRVKGQGVYFVILKDGNPTLGLIFTFGRTPLHYCWLEKKDSSSSSDDSIYSEI